MYINAAILALSLVLQPTRVFSHGYVQTFAVEGGKSYRGNQPAESTQRSPSAIRQIADTLPVKGTGNRDLICGRSATSGSLVADVNPGDTVSFNWSGAGGTAWPHDTGPVITYMASCGSVSCDKFNPSGAKWFKISNLVKKANGEWFQADIRRRIPMKVQIPSTLAAGNYLIRQEIIALHLGASKGGVEFYPSCTQLRVGGTQTGRPADGDLVTIPGLYYDEHPGLWVKDLYQPGYKYTVPGPAVAKIAGGAGGGAPAPSTTSKPAASSSTSTRASTTTTKASSSTSVRPAPTSTSTRSSSSSAPQPTQTELPAPIANVAKPPSSTTTSAALVATPSSEVVKVCRHRKRSSLKYMQAKLAKRAAEPAAAVLPVVARAPLRSRHSRRAMFRHGSSH